jgi:hypothetical protein
LAGRFKSKEFVIQIFIIGLSTVGIVLFPWFEYKIIAFVITFQVDVIVFVLITRLRFLSGFLSSPHLNQLSFESVYFLLQRLTQLVRGLLGHLNGLKREKRL